MSPKKHYCPVCRTGFPSRRTLGRHMPVHEINANPTLQQDFAVAAAAAVNINKRKREAYDNNEASTSTPPPNKRSNIPPPPQFECSTCKKVFESHQAMGGHRASHKKVKGCFAACAAENQPQDGIKCSKENIVLPKKKADGSHRCNVCGREFPSGQALGGHKRLHYNNPKPVLIQDAVVVEPVVVKSVYQTLDLISSMDVEYHVDACVDVVDGVVTAPEDVSTMLCLRPWWNDDDLVALRFREMKDREEDPTWLRLGVGPHPTNST